jgi:hypothetical protein
MEMGGAEFWAGGPVRNSCSPPFSIRLFVMGSCDLIPSPLFLPENKNRTSFWNVVMQSA